MGLATEDQIDSVKSEVRDAVAVAVKFAEESPEPDPSEIFNDVLA